MPITITSDPILEVSELKEITGINSDTKATVLINSVSKKFLNFTQRTHINGRISFWRKNLAPLVNLNKTINDWGVTDAPVPDELDYNDLTWTPAERSGDHAGILTLPGYTLRFHTNRGRANRFRVVFTGQYFVPPAGADTDCDPETDDLTERCTCRHCHQVLEPLAAHFATVIEAGSAMVDADLLPLCR